MPRCAQYRRSYTYPQRRIGVEGVDVRNNVARQPGVMNSTHHMDTTVTSQSLASHVTRTAGKKAPHKKRSAATLDTPA